MFTLETSVKDLTRVGIKVAKRLNELRIFTAKDLLFYFPFRYDDFSNILSIKEMGRVSGPVTVKCRVEMIETHRSPRHRKLYTEALVSDNSGKMKVIWFNQPFMKKVLSPGDDIYLSGKITSDYWGSQMINPVYEKIAKRESIHTARLVPIYPLTEKLTQKQLRFLIKLVLPLRYKVQDPLPYQIRRNANLLELKDALKFIHFPENKQEAEKAAKRFKFEEFFYLQLENELSRRELLREKAPKIQFFEEKTKNFVNSLSFQLTDAQRKAAWEILKDLGARKSVIIQPDRAIQKSEIDSLIKPRNDKEEDYISPMNRLLNGDVGSGKTIVAAISIFNVVLNKFQAAFMSPTEILAAQHFNTFSKLFRNEKIKIGLLTRGFSKISFKGEVKDIKRNELIEDIKSGDTDLIIGTHTLIQENIKFWNLALAIVDEQHRFGVKQRALLSARGNTWTPKQNLRFAKGQAATRINAGKISTHFLSMTATPIPRTLALIAYGDLDISILNEMPKGRKSIITKLISPESKSDAYSFLRKQIKAGRQLFVICPLIDPSDKLGVRSVKEVYERLKNDIFPEFKVEVLHGKMKSKEKNKIMEDFKNNKIQILVSTTVVEVGVDVPNATLMIIEGAERFGLAQLHQLRGRVGRGEEQSYCLVFLETTSDEAKARLKIFANIQNGFELAEYDLKFRGPGDILGVRQSGLPTLKFANLDDIEILKLARDEAKKYINIDPELKRAPMLKQMLEIYRKEVHLE